MPKFLKLAGVMIKNSGNLLNNANKKEKNNKSLLPILIVGAAILFISSIMMYVSAFSIASLDNNGNITAVDYNYISSVLKVIYPQMFLLLFVFLNTLVITTFFLSTDSATFLHLPLKPYEIFLAKFICCLIYGYAIELLFIAPINVAYMITIVPSLLTIVNQILFLVVMPLIPISFAFIISFLISKIINIQKHRDASVFILSIISVIAVIAIETVFNTAIPSDIESMDGAMIEEFKENIIDSANKMGGLGKVFGFILDGFTNFSINGFINTLIFVLISIAIVTSFAFIANKFYQKNLLDENTDHSRSRKKKGPLSINVKSPTASYLGKELKMLFRSPNILMQTVFPPLIMIAVIIVTIISACNSDPVMNEDTTYWMNEIQKFFDSYSATLPVIGLALSSITCSMVMVSSTTFSREGPNIYLLKLIPLAPIKQIRIKMIPGTLVSAIINVLLIAAAGIIFKINIFIIIITLFLSILLTIMCNYIMITLDLKHPFLDWSNEVGAVKQNKVALISLLITFGIALGFGIIAFIVGMLKIHLALVCIISLLIIIGVIIIFELHFHKKRHSIFEHLN